MSRRPITPLGRAILAEAFAKQEARMRLRETGRALKQEKAELRRQERAMVAELRRCRDEFS